MLTAKKSGTKYKVGQDGKVYDENNNVIAEDVSQVDWSKLK